MSQKLRKSVSLLLSLCMVLSLFSGVVLTSAVDSAVTWSDTDDHYTLAVSQGSSAVTNGSAVTEGTEVLVVLTVEDGYLLDSLKVHNTSDTTQTVELRQGVEGNYYFTMPGYAVTIAVATEPVSNGYQVSIHVPSNGLLSVANSSTGATLSTGDYVLPGQVVTLTAAPNSDYVLDSVTVTGTDSGSPVAPVSQSADGSYYFTMPEYAVTIEAAFAEASAAGYTVSWTSPGTGYTIQTVTDATAGTQLTSADTLVPAGHEVAVGLSVETGYLLQSLSVAAADNTGASVEVRLGADGKYYFTMPEYDVKVTPAVVEESAGYALTWAAEAGQNYTISDVMDSTAAQQINSSDSVLPGQTVSFAVAPNANYSVVSVTAAKSDDAGVAVLVTQGEDGRYYFTMPDYAVKLGAEVEQTVFTTATTTTLTYTDFTSGGLFAGDVVNLNASVAVADGGAAVTGGWVTFYYVTGTVPDGIPFAQAELIGGRAYTVGTAPEGLTGFKAVYSGIQDLYTSSQGTVNAPLTSRQIAWGSSSSLTTESALQVNTGYTLTVPAVVASGSSTPLTAGADYLVTWQMYKDGVWVNIEENTDDTTYSVTADEINIRYRALVLPVGNYTLPAAGLLSAEVSVTKKLDPSFTLNVSAGRLEGDLVTVTLSSNQDPAPTGTVRFTMPDGTKLSAELVGDSAEVQWTVPSAYVNTGSSPVTGAVTANYLGDGVYESTTKTETNLVWRTRTISGADAQISANDGTNSVSVLTAQTQYALSLTGVKNAQGVALTENTDYTVTWYVSTGNGAYTRVADASAVTPQNTRYSYKAVVEPAGDQYKFGAFEALIGCDNLKASVTSILATHASTDTANNPATFEGQALTFTATVTAGGQNVNGGVVAFYAVKDGATVQIGSANVVDGKAILVYNGLTAGTYAIMAQYSGIDGMFAASAETLENVVIIPAVLDNSTWTLNATELEIGTATDLSVNKADMAANYVYNRDYSIVWQLSKDGGLTWTNTEASESLTAKPMDRAWQYRALVYPMGNYTSTQDGAYITVGTAAARPAATTAALTAVNEDGSAEVYEGHDRILLSAEIGSANLDVTVGVVSFYVSDTQYTVISDITNNATKLGDADVNILGGAALNIPAPAAGEYFYYAVYSSGVNGSFTESFAEAQLTVYSTTIQFADANPAITANPAELAVGGSYTLTAPDVVSADGMDLTVDVDYYYIWYYTPDGSNWYMVPSAGPSNICEGGFDSEDAMYRAVAYPMGDYRLPEGGIAVSLSGAAAIETQTTLAVSGEFELASGMYYFPSGTQIVLTAQVLDGTGNPASGVVRFYRDGVEIASAQYLDAAGKASVTITADTVDSDYAAAYYAEFIGNEVYDASVSGTVDSDDNITIVPNRIALETKDIAGADGGMTVGQTYTLRAPDVVIDGSDSTDALTRFVLDNAYYYKWQVSYDDGVSWMDLAQTGASVTVTPENIHYAYRVIAMPVSTTGFINPYTGDVSNIVETVNKAESNVEIEVQGLIDGYAYEGDVLTLTAKVPEVKRYNLDNQGSVTFYYSLDGGATLLLIPYPATVDVDAAGEATVSFVMPDYVAGSQEKIIFYAYYSGSEHFAPSEDDTGDAVTIRSTAIAWGEDGGEVLDGITIYNGTDTSANGSIVADGVMKAGNTYTLVLPEVYAEDDLDTPLRPGLDYNVEWYYSSDDGASWNLAAWVGDDQTILTVEDEQVGWSYRAYVYPYNVINHTVLSHYEKAVAYPKADPVAYANYLTAEIRNRTELSSTQTTLSVSEYYSLEDDAAIGLATEGQHMTEFEGQTVLLTATVVELETGNENAVESGYVIFYKNGTEIGRVELSSTNTGIVTFEAEMSEYDEANTAAENKDVFTAVYSGNEYYQTSASGEQTVYIRSSAIDTPIISAAYGDPAETKYTTKDEGITGLPAGVEITFTLIDDVANYASVVATDGRAVSPDDYTIRWQMLTGTSSFADATLVAGSVYTENYVIPFGNVGDTYRVYLEPKNNMTAGAASQNAVIGEKLVPTVILTPEFIYDPTLDVTYAGVDTTRGAHFGDEVTLTATVKGVTTAPTGWAEFFYTSGDGETVSLGSVELTGNGVANEAAAELKTTQLPVDKLTLYAVYKGYDADSDGEFEGDVIYTTAESGKTAYKIWSVNLSNEEFTEVKNTETGYGLITISAIDAEGSPVAVGEPLTANDTYTLTLGDVYTKSGEKLDAGEYTVQWFTSTDYVPGTAPDVNDAAAKWTHLSALDDMTTVTVTPESQNTMYIALVTTTDSLYNKDYPSTSLADSEYTNIIGAALQSASVTVTTSAQSIYQANDLTIFAQVDPEIAGDVAGYVEFYYTFAREDADYEDAVWYPVVSKEADGGNTAALVVKSGESGKDAVMIAQITTNSLYVEADGTASRLVFRADYLGNDTYSPASNLSTETMLVDCEAVDVYSSIIYVDEATENQYVTRETGAKGIVIEPASPLVSDGAVTYLTLNPIYTLDAYDASGELGIMENAPEFSWLTIGEDYTVLWQQCPIDAAGLDTWQTIATSSDAMQSNIVPQEGYAYRAAIVTLETSEKVKAAYLGWNDIVHGIDGIDNDWITNGVASGIYYSNIITVGAGNAVLGLNVVPASSVAVDGDEVTFEVLVNGGETTPNGKVTLTVTNEDGDVVFSDSANLVSGMVSIPWTQADGTTMVKVPAGTYTVSVSAVLNNGYIANPIEETYIVRYTDHTMEGPDQSEIYDADRQSYDIDSIVFTFDNFYDIDESDLEALAAQMVVISYYDEQGNKVESPVDAGTYTVKAYLPESIYWTEIAESTIATLTVNKRALSVVDIIVQHKVYDGTTNADILVATLEDAATDQDDTGLPIGNTGLIDGDSVYAVGTARTSTANAGSCRVTFTTTSLEGPDAHNYRLPASYTEDFEIYRNQLKGEFQSGVVIPFAGFAAADVADYFTVIEEGGSEFTDYTLTWYYHNAGSITKVEDVDALLASEDLVLNDTYVFTVVLRPANVSNYKGGVTGTITVDRNATAATVPALGSYESSILHISNTYEVYGDADNTGIAVNLTNADAAATVEYYVDGAWTTTVPAEAGRYAVVVTASTGDMETGIYTLVKAEGIYKTPYVEGKVFDGLPVTYNAAGEGMDWPEGTYATWSGGRIQGFSYEAPKDAGIYLVTVHIPETENYVAATVSYLFTIAKRTVNVTAGDIYNNLFATNPKMYVEYELASGGETGIVEGDSSLRDILIDPTLLLTRINGTGTGDSLNDVGEYAIDATGASAYNYVFTYSQGALSMNATDPQEALTILGAPDGTIRYGDTFTLFGYGNKGQLIGGGGINKNNSSEISWAIISGTDVATIDANGNVAIIGVGEFTVRYTRGTGAYMIYVDETYTAYKKQIGMLIADEDFVYDAEAHVISDANFSFEGLVGRDTLTVTGNTIVQAPASTQNDLTRDDWDAGYTDVGEYVVNAGFETDLYYGTGAGLLTINRKEAEIAPDTDAAGLDGEMTYGEDPDSALTLGYAEFGAIDPDILLTGGIAVSAVDANDDVGEYEILVGSGKADNNYNIAFISKGYASGNDIDTVIVVANNSLTIDSGWSPYSFAADDTDSIAYTPVERMYGEPMPNANTDIDGLIDGDSAADLDLTDGYVVTKDTAGNSYSVPVEANKGFNDSASAPGAAAAAAYSGAADIYVLDIAEVANMNPAYKNYLANLQGDAAVISELRYDVFQRPITLKAKDAASKNLDVVHSSAADSVYTQLLDMLEAGQWQGIGGLAEAYGETIEDLGVYFELYDANGNLIATVYADHITGNADFLKPGSNVSYRVVPRISNTNYKLMEADELTLTVTLTKVLAIVTPGQNNGATGFTVTTYICTYNPETDTWTQTKAFLSSAINYEIFVRTSDNDYTDETPVRSGVMKRTSSIGVYTCSYSKLSNGGYEIFLSAEGYNIVRTM